MKLPARSQDIAQRRNAVASYRGGTFRGLLEAAGYDPNTDLRFRNLSGVSFAGEDLRGMDFTGTNLCKCNFENAQIEGARFDQARIGQFRPIHLVQPSLAQLHVIDLTKAKDWRAHVLSDWKPAELKATDDHLPVGAVFQDAHIAPEMIVLPASGQWKQPEVRIMRRIAVSRYTIGEHDRKMLLGVRVSSFRGVSPEARLNVLKYCEYLRQKTGKNYRLPTRMELLFACAFEADLLRTDWRRSNEFGVSRRDKEHDQRLEDFGWGSTPRITVEWCCDDDDPVCMASGSLRGRDVKIGDRDLTAKEARFHVVRELESDLN
jgi:hypothetical protein